MYDYDNNGLIINGEGTAEQAAEDLLLRGGVVLNWTDGDGTVFNIVLTYAPTRMGTTCGLIDGMPSKLWVGVAGRGCYAFTVAPRNNPLVGPYIGEKFKIHSIPTAAVLADLLTDVRDELGGMI